jgi:dTMP kinase
VFISFEGGEGAGKSTQIQDVASWLRAQGQSVLVTRQPGGTDYGQRIRSLILDHHDSEVLSPRAELFLYLADRAHHVDTVIRPALQAGQIVICDRYTDSTLAYQGFARELDLTELKTLNHLATKGLQPDLTFWLDLDPAIGHERLGVRPGKDRLESEALSFHARVRTGYATLAKDEPQRWRRIDASLPQADVLAQLQAVLQDLLSL